MINEQITAKVIEDSTTADGIRLTTLQLRYPKFFHIDFLTHRMFSRSASSSRAIPVMKMLKQIWNDPAMPVYWGKNKAGMQAGEELTGIKLKISKFVWRTASKFAAIFSYCAYKCGLHKQIANRLTDTFQLIHVVVTATEWDNFFELRNHPDAQPEIQELAKKMYYAINNSDTKLLNDGEWHLPYVSDIERKCINIEFLKKISTARNARVSYLTHDGKSPDISKDIKLHDDLVDSVPIHASPSEHVATPSGDNGFHKNFRGWVQYREEVEKRIHELPKIEPKPDPYFKIADNAVTVFKWPVFNTQPEIDAFKPQT